VGEFKEAKAINDKLIDAYELDVLQVNLLA